MSTAAAALVSGFTAYTDVQEFGAEIVAEAPASTPAVLSFIAISTVGCGTAIGGATASIATTIANGC